MREIITLLRQRSITTASAFALAVAGWAASANAAVVVTFDSETYVGGNVATDNGLVTQISSTDVVEPFTPSISGTVSIGSAAQLTDGNGGEQDFAPDGRFFFSDGTVGTVTFSGLTAFNLGEVRVYSFNTDSRAVQNYTLAIDTGSGFGLPIISPTGGTSNAGVVSRIFDDNGAFIATGVVGLQFTFTNNAFGRQQATVEIDVFDLSPVTIPAPAALPAGIAVIGLALVRRRRRDR